VLFLGMLLTGCRLQHIGTTVDVRLDCATQKAIISGLPSVNGVVIVSDAATEYLCRGLTRYGRREVVDKGCAVLREMDGFPLEGRNMLLQGQGLSSTNCPTWDEVLLCAASSSNMVPVFVREESKSGDFEESLASCFTDKKDQNLRHGKGLKVVELKGGEGDRYFLVFNVLSARCMCYSRFAMRVFNARGKWVWEELNEVYDSCEVYVGDINGDGADDVVIRREGHTPLTYLLWIRK
jgi:hypothetical protein